MKIAIVCDWLVTVGGAEKVLTHLIDCYPKADIFSVVNFLDQTQKKNILRNKKVTTTYIQCFPFAKKYYRQYLPWMPLAIEQLDLSQYDLIISSSHAVAKGVTTGPNQLHISYVHSPMRYAWDLQHQYLKQAGLDKGIKGFFTKYMLHKLRIWDRSTANGVDEFVANSNFIARRIWKAYRREAAVIYPPVDIKAVPFTGKREDFYLAASRLVPYKKIDLIAESFASMPNKKLVIIGDGPEMSKIKKHATSNIEILGYQPSEILIQYMQQAKAFIFAAEEDFGILPVEAQSYGTPVIAFGKGGSLETVRGLNQPEPTGIFFYKQTVESICKAVQEFEHQSDIFTPDNCVFNASQFSSTLFKEKFMAFVKERIDQGK